MKPWHFSSAAILALAAADPALAHTMGGSVAGFGAGFSHPLFGMDHLLAMLAIGMWAAQAGTAAAWRIPLVFVAALAAGGWLGMLGVGLPLVEPGIAASLLALGLLISFQVSLPPPTGMALAAIFALWHGHAHGSEMPLAAAPWLYALGFLSATGLLHLIGFVAGKTVTGLTLRICGGIIAAAGLFAAAT